MNTKLSSTWGVVPGRHLGGHTTKRFHKRRAATTTTFVTHKGEVITQSAERDIAKAHGVTLKEARRMLRYAQASNARKDAATIERDTLKLEAERQRKIMSAKVKAQGVETERAARVADYLKSLES